jgi:hypothetical protein
MKGKKWLLLMASGLLVLLVVANTGSVKALYTPPTWPADYQWRGVYDTITCTIYDTTPNEPSAYISWGYPWRQDFLSGPDTTTHPSTVALENLREIVWAPGGYEVIDEGYYDSTTGTHIGYVGAKSHTVDGGTVPPSAVTTWTNGPWVLNRTLFCMWPDVPGLCIIDYKIFYSLGLVGHVAMAVLWNYPLQNPATTAADARSYIDSSMTAFYTSHVSGYQGILMAGVVFQICYSFDDCMKQQTIGTTLSDHSVEAWSGATPPDFLSAPIPYNSPSWSPVTPLPPNQPSGSKVLWGIVHVPEPTFMKVDVCTLPYTAHNGNGVGPQNAFGQYIIVTYNWTRPVGGIWHPALLTVSVSLTPFAILSTAMIVFTISVVYRKKRGTTKASNQTP